MTAKDTNDVQAWENSSQFWNKYQAAIEKMFAALTDVLIAEAQIQPGQSVLDVGGGSGEPSLTISAIAGSEGSITYTDPAAGMLRVARAEAERRGLTNIAFQQVPAESLPFPDDSFDVVVGRLSAMFFENPKSAINEILRVVKPGGRVTLLVWAARAANPFFSVISDVFNRFVPAEPAEEAAPDAFRFGNQGKLASVFREASVTSVTERPFSFSIEYPIDVEKFWEMRTEMSDTFRSRLAQLSADQVDEVKAATTVAVAQYFKNGHMKFPAQVLIVSGQK